MTDRTRERAEELAEQLIDDAIPVDADDGVVFDAPWQARLFGLAVAFHEAHEDYDWDAFQERLVRAVADANPQKLQDDVEGAYYERWLETLESFLVEEGILSRAEIERRQAAFSAGERDASEFGGGDHSH